MEEQIYRLNRTVTACWVVVAIAFTTLALLAIHHQVTPLFAFTWTHPEFTTFIWTFGLAALPFFIVGGLAENKLKRLEN